MGVLDKFLEVMKLDGDDDYDEDDFFDEDDFEDEYEEEKPKRGIFKKEKAVPNAIMYIRPYHRTSPKSGTPGKSSG